ncbi:hypothetical protein EVAR_16816_1 [Eumeta japonica]|uniref:Uncharacterized protein n=1 Tax=Eumeta variegata TaxID=151549 RepID=A0A4C1V3J9_EUMVA|nr:hypothetical protein EVAR_16816_1 [Eumeta japonica]
MRRTRELQGKKMSIVSRRVTSSPSRAQLIIGGRNSSILRPCLTSKCEAGGRPEGSVSFTGVKWQLVVCISSGERKFRWPDPPVRRMFYSRSRGRQRTGDRFGVATAHGRRCPLTRLFPEDAIKNVCICICTYSVVTRGVNSSSPEINLLCTRCRYAS